MIIPKFTLSSTNFYLHFHFYITSSKHIFFSGQKRTYAKRGHEPRDRILTQCHNPLAQRLRDVLFELYSHAWSWIGPCYDVRQYTMVLKLLSPWSSTTSISMTLERDAPHFKIDTFAKKTYSSVMLHTHLNTNHYTSAQFLSYNKTKSISIVLILID